jgi:hypothetical protein
MPPPAPSASVDEAILDYQIHSTIREQPADILLIGDSSCLMDCSASGLQQQLPGHRVVNLGTLSYLDLRAFGLLLRRFAATNPGSLRTVVLLVHPEMLRGTKLSGDSDQAVTSWTRQIEGREEAAPEVLSFWRVPSLLKRHVLDYVLPSVLPGTYGHFYGFNTTLQSYMREHRGSAIDPRQYQRRTTRDPQQFVLSSQLEEPSLAFKSFLPHGVELAVGIAPVPQSETSATYGKNYQEILSRWSGWIKPDVVLSNLPPTLADPFFASQTHLNQRGAKRYTKLLSRSLKPHLTGSSVNGTGR